MTLKWLPSALISVVCCLSTEWVAVSSGAEPYVPTSDDEVIEVLPRALMAGQGELRDLQVRLKRRPRDERLAEQLAAKYIAIGDASNDPRYYGYAQAVLQPWWGVRASPAPILRLRAKLHEKNHRYAEALSDLQRFVEQRPRDAQGWIELSNIHRVLGNYAESQHACDQLREFAGSFSVALCQAPLLAVTGRAEEADALLGRIPSTARDRLGDTYQWVLALRAELARILGRDAVAEKHFREALALDADDKYVRRAYADFLLEQGRPRAALKIAEDVPNDNGLLLLAAIAALRAGEHTLAEDWTAQLGSRFAELRLRGEVPHGRFEARFALELEGDPEKALEIALTNWERQKEAPDTRNVLEAAIATQTPRAAQEVLEFLRRHGTEDVTLRSLAQQLEPLQ